MRKDTQQIPRTSTKLYQLCSCTRHVDHRRGLQCPIGPQQNQIHLSWNHQQKQTTSLTLWISLILLQQTQGFRTNRTDCGPIGLLVDSSHSSITSLFGESGKTAFKTAERTHHSPAWAQITRWSLPNYNLAPDKANPPVKDPMKQTGGQYHQITN